MFLVGFEHTISVFELAKTVHALERAATVIGIGLYIAIFILLGCKQKLPDIIW
jgi:hypothetical protein